MLNLIKLENRIVLDGAAVGEALDHAAEQDANVVGDEAQVSDHASDAAEDVAGAAALLSNSEVSEEPLNIVLVSDSLPDYQTLADAAEPGTQVIVYDADTESAQEVIDRVTALAEETGQAVNSVTILSHGGAGYFNLGNEAVSAESLDENSAVWAELDAVMAEESAIYVFGCSVADGSDSGQSLLNGLAEATGADVFASDDITGNSGDWELEASSDGADENAFEAFPLNTDALADYSGSLVDADGDGIEDPFFDLDVGHRSDEDGFSSFGLLVYVDEDFDTPWTRYAVDLDDNNDPVFASVEGAATWAEVTGEPGVVDRPGYRAWNIVINYAPTSDQNTDGRDDAIITAILVDTVKARDESSVDIPIEIRGKNDAPVMNDSGTMELDDIDEDTTNPSGDTVAEILASVSPLDPITDVDANAQEGIAVIGVDDQNSGTWQYSTDNGNTWITFGNISESNATVLTSEARIRFVPAANYATDPTAPQTEKPNLTILAWDQTDGSANGDTGVNTVRSTNIQPAPRDVWAFSRASEIVSIDINEVPDPPIIDPTAGEAQYVENDNPVAVDPTISVSDIDSDTLSGATVQITGNYQNNAAGSDRLVFSNTGNITGSWDAATGTLTLSGTASVSQYEAALRSVSFEHVGGVGDGDDPNQNSRTVTFTVTDDTGLSASGTRDVSVDAINDAPDLSPDSGTLNYQEDSGAVAIDSDIQLTDVDDDNMTGATIQITENYQSGEDALVYTGTVSGITSSWDAATGILTLSGTASKSAYEQALQAVAYENTSQNPNEAARQVTFTVTDANSRGLGDGPGGGAKSATAVRTITVAGVADPPEIDLDPDDDGGDGPGGEAGDSPDFHATYTENEPPVKITDVDAEVTDVDSTHIQSMTITITNFVAGQDVLDADTTGTNISMSYNANTGVLTLTGTDTLENYSQVLRTVTYENTSEDPDTTTRVVDFVAVDDTGLQSEAVQSFVEVIPVNDPPEIDLTGPGDATTDFNQEFTPGEGAVDLTQNGLDGTLSDVDDENLSELTVTITNLKPGDELGFDTTGTNITGTYANGVLTLTGVDSVANYQQVLNTVTFNNTTDPGSYTDDMLQDRVIQFVAKDNGDNTGVIESSNIATATVDMRPVTPAVDLDPDDDGGDGDDPGSNPGISPDFNVSFVEGCGPVYIADTTDTNAMITDPDSENLQGLSVTIQNMKLSDVLAFDASGTNITGSYNADTGVLTLTGVDTLANYESVLRSVTFNNTSQAPDPETRQLSVVVTDEDGNTSEAVTSNVTVIPTNDAPVNNFPTEQVVQENGSLVLNNVTVGDVDIEQGGSGTVSVTLSAGHGVLTVTTANSGAQITGDGTQNLTLEGTLAQINAALNGLTYTPEQDFTGQDTLTITTNDQGYSGVGVINGVKSTDPDFCAQTKPGAITIEDLTGIRDDAKDAEGNPNSPHALTDVDTITIRVIAPTDPDTPPDVPDTPDVPFIPITRPEGEDGEPVTQGIVRLPGPVGITEGVGLRDLTRGIGPDGPEIPPPFCSIEEALRVHLGCRFANTTDPEAKFGSLSWGDMTDLGWRPPYEYLDEEYDLYSRLFLRQPDDPGFNVESGVFLSDLGGLPEERSAEVFRGGSGEDFNDLEPGEVKEAFFAGRKALDKTWR